MSLSYGLNITKKPPISQRPAPAKRKTIFDDDSGPEDGPDDEEDRLESISTIGGLQKPASKPPPSSKKTPPPSSSSSHPPKKPPKISQYGDLSTLHTTTNNINKHAKSAQEIDPSIYDYDAAYDSLHAATSGTNNSTSSQADTLNKKPKYMSNLLAAADVRKRDALRAKEKMLAKEREAEGDDFKDKEAFVTGAYKRQQAEMRALEEEEKVREGQAEERRRREGGGMKALYKNLLERDEERHRGVMQAVEEGRKGGGGEEKEEEEDEGKEGGGGSGGKKEKSEAELAKEMGAQVNEDGQIVDKRQLLGAGLNAGAAAPLKASRRAVDSRQRDPRGRKPESARERESRMFEEQLLLGKRSASPDDRDSRAAKSRKMEDELLASMGSP